MMRLIVAVVAGSVSWIAFATLCGLLLRATWPAYVAAEPDFAFTLPMLGVRLLIGAAATVLAGLVVALVARGERRVAWAMALWLLILFVPQHIYLFTKFPLWYHAVFLTSLLPLTFVGAWLTGSKTSS